MSNRLTFDGLAELRRELKNLPQEMTGEARHEVEAAANGAASEIKRGYPAISGRLRDGVIVTHLDPGPFGAGAEVKNTAPHAWLYDNGSQARHWISGKSTGRMWGHTRPTHHFVRNAIKARKRMYERLKAMIARKGFVVSGDA